MKKIITVVFMCTFFSAVSISAQGFWPSNYSADELLNSISAKASGMGETGVSHVHEKSFYFNPGTLGLFAMKNRIVATGFIQKAMNETDDFYNTTLSIPLRKYKKGKTKFLISIGVYYSISKKLRPLQETTPDFPNGTGVFYTPSYSNDNSTIAIGYDGRLQVGFGITLRQREQSINSIKKNAVDVGVVARYPIIPDIEYGFEKIYYLPSFGYSVSNLDPEIGYTTDGGNVFLPQKKTIGISLETGILQKIDFRITRVKVSILPSFELYKIKENDWQKKYGFEVGFYEALYLRVGRIDDDSYFDKTTEGFSLNSRGIFGYFQNEDSSKDTRKGINRLLTDIISIQYSFANSVIMKSYHELIVTLQL